MGRAIALHLASKGAIVAIHHHSSPSEAESAAAEIRELGSDAAIFQADLTRLPEIDDLISAVTRELGPIQVLVNNAASFQHKRVLDITPADWDYVMSLNLRAPFFCSQRVAKVMREAGVTGAIVNISDVGGLQPWPGYAQHSISKAGLIMMTRVLARALAPEILVNAIAPGPVLPPEELGPDERQELADATALKRLGSPEDVARTAAFLLESEYITGETVVVDGGKMLLA